MATTVNIYVDPSATGTGSGADWTNAYTSLNAALAANDKDLVTADEVHVYNCRCSGDIVDYTAVAAASLASYVTDATRYIEIRCDDGTYAIAPNSGSAFVSSNTSLKHIRMFGLQVAGAGTATVDFASSDLNGGDVRIERCQIISAGTYGVRCAFTSTTGTFVCKNNLIAGNPRYIVACFGPSDQYIYNNSGFTSYVSGTNTTYGIFSNNGTGSKYAKNNVIVINNTTYGDAFSSQYDANGDYNASNINDGDAGANFTDLSSYSAAAIMDEPFAGKLSMAADLAGSGTDLSAATHGFSDDLFGTSRSSWKKGCFAAAAGPSVTTETYYVDPGASGTGDGSSWTNAYTSLNAALDARETNLISDGKRHIFKCRKTGANNDTTQIASASCDAYRTDQWHDIVVESDDQTYVNAYSSGQDIWTSPTGKHLAWVTLRGLQFNNQNNSVNTRILGWGNRKRFWCGRLLVERCKFEVHTASTTTLLTIGDNNNAERASVVVFRCNINIEGRVPLISTYLNVVYAYNNTKYASYSSTSTSNFGFGGSNNGGSKHLANCAVLVPNSTTVATFDSYWDGAAPALTTNNASTPASTQTNATSVNYVNLSSYTIAQIVTDAANDDFTPVTSGPLDSAGANISAYPYAPTVDYYGNSWGTDFDIGAIKIVATGTDITVELSKITGTAAQNSPTYSIDQILSQLRQDLSSSQASASLSTDQVLSQLVQGLVAGQAAPEVQGSATIDLSVQEALQGMLGLSMVTDQVLSMGDQNLATFLPSPTVLADQVLSLSRIDSAASMSSLTLSLGMTVQLSPQTILSGQISPTLLTDAIVQASRQDLVSEQGLLSVVLAIDATVVLARQSVAAAQFDPTVTAGCLVELECIELGGRVVTQGIVYVLVDGQWKPMIPHVLVNGQWVPITS